MDKYFSGLVEQALSRSTESTLSILSITDPGLREHLGSLMRAECGKEGAFLPHRCSSRPSAGRSAH